MSEMKHLAFFREEFFGAILYLPHAKEYFFFDHDETDAIHAIRSGSCSQELCEFQKELEENHIDVHNLSVIQHAKEQSLSAPLRVFIDITYRCNLRCKHCFTDSSAFHPEELTTEDLYSLIRQMREAGTFLLSIAGGEPLLRSDIFDVIQYAREQYIDVSMTSNGLVITEEIARRLHESGLRTITISVDGMESTHDAIRGQGNWKKTVENIRLLRRYCHSATIGIRNTVNTHNLHEAQSLITLAEDLGVDVLKFNPMRCFGRAEQNRYLLISQEQYVAFLREVNSIQAKVKISVPKTPLDSRPYEFIDLGFGCTGGRETCNITPKGDFSACAFLGDGFVVGNIKDTSFCELWERVNKSVEYSLSTTCTSCSEYRNCRGGCRSRALYECGNINTVDPLCVLGKASRLKLTIRQDPDEWMVYHHGSEQYEKYCSFDAIQQVYPSVIEQQEYRFVENKMSMPLKLFFDPTHACNSRCIHCYNNSGKASPHEITLQEVTKIAQQLYQHGICQVSIAGGEPFLVPQVFDMIKIFETYNISVSITTNGILLTEDRVRQLLECSVKGLTISIDGVTRETYHHYRGVDAFEKVCENISLLKQQFPGELSMRFSVMKGNGSPAEVVAFAVAQGFETLKVNKTHLLGRFCEHAFYCVTDEEYDRIIEQFYILKEAAQIELELPREKYLQTGVSLPCSAGKKTIFLSPEAEVFPCPFIDLSFCFGSIRESSLFNLLEKHQNFSVDNEYCRSCPAMKKSHNITKKELVRSFHG